MSRIDSVEERNRAFVKKSIQAWDRERQLEKRNAPPPRPCRRKRGIFGRLRQNYGFAALAIFLAFAAWPQVAESVATLPGASGLMSAADNAQGDRSFKKATARNAERGDISMAAAQNFPLCSAGRRVTCVVDGDTFWLEGEKIRIADMNAPEVSSPKCASEKALGDRATRRLQGLLNAGAFEMQGEGNDRYGRSLRTLHRNGQSLGRTMVDEGFAHTWRGHRESWCG